jgi:hypothetical protein
LVRNATLLALVIVCFVRLARHAGSGAPDGAAPRLTEAAT